MRLAAFMFSALCRANWMALISGNAAWLWKGAVIPFL
jgi:hypothetical protein